VNTCKKDVSEAEQRLIGAVLAYNPAEIDAAIKALLAARQGLEDRKKLWLQRRIEQARAEQAFNRVDFGLEIEVKHVWTREFTVMSEIDRDKLVYELVVAEAERLLGRAPAIAEAPQQGDDGSGSGASGSGKGSIAPT
jgi:hypothetical protein